MSKTFKELFDEFNNNFDYAEYEREIDRRNQAVKEEFLKLEEELKERGLKFYNYNGGACPMQIYGEIDGQKFYWRTRNNASSLTVGPFNEALDTALADKQLQHYKERYNQHKKTCTEERCFECLILEDKSTNRDVNHPHSYYPRQVTKVADIEQLVEGDNYKGDLEIYEINPVFKELLSRLKEVPREEQVSIFTIASLAQVDKEQLYFKMTREESIEKVKEFFKENPELFVEVQTS